MVDTRVGNGRMYASIIERLFLKAWHPGSKEVGFLRTDIETEAAALDVKLPKNLGDLIYSFRFRRALPEAISSTAPAGQEWIIELAGNANYRFVLARASRVRPQDALVVIDLPNATPDIVLRYPPGDEQALLAKLRYNRLIDIFLGISTYSLQNHLRTSIKVARGRTQIEIDELYVGLNMDGEHFVVPVQAKVGRDQIGIVQTQQDVSFCTQRFPDLQCRPVAAQALDGEVIALFELVLRGGELRVREARAPLQVGRSAGLSGGQAVGVVMWASRSGQPRNAFCSGLPALSR